MTSHRTQYFIWRCQMKLCQNNCMDRCKKIRGVSWFVRENSFFPTGLWTTLMYIHEIHLWVCTFNQNPIVTHIMLLRNKLLKYCKDKILCCHFTSSWKYKMSSHDNVADDLKKVSPRSDERKLLTYRNRTGNDFIRKLCSAFPTFIVS